ncbi:MAG TPA: AAA family ATPase [Tepidisphaeraceae bacterium]|nr:AAA family ATPase [Tepidisphaeraceae bacterium]
MHTRIDDIEYPEAMRKSLPQTPDFVLPDKQLLLSFIHRGKDRQAIEYSAESAGTRKLLNISEELWILAHESVATFADELSASLHPRLLDVLVRAINEPDSQRIQSQLIFATHDTSLLEGRDGLPPALRRDQVYFTKKGTEGMSELYSLAEFKDNARPNHNLRKRYMEGLYGAIPLVEKLTL